ncbi:peptidase, partial [Yersinia pestis]
GFKLSRTAPTVWNKVIAKDWNGLVNAFNNIVDGMSDRRKREGALVQKDIDSGLLK